MSFHKRVEVAQELSHHGDEGGFPGFSLFEEALVKPAEDFVVFRPGKGGHVDRFSDLAAASVDFSLAFELA